jgi:1-deoxy-D-xylulose-5-phosphate synthase
VAPLDSDALHAIFKKFKYIITVEDGILRGGFGSAVIEFMADYGYNAEIRRLGIPDYFVEHGTQDELYRECGYDAEGIELAIREVMVRGEGTGEAETRRSGDGAKDKNRINNSV